jgi:outer membrane protein
MHNLKLFFLVHFFIIIAFIIPSYGADAVKISVVDTQRVLDTSLLGKQMTNELNKLYTGFSADLEAKGKEIQKLQEEAEKLSLSKETLSEANKEKFDKTTRELRIKIYDGEKLKEKYQDDFKKEEIKRLKYITKIVEEIIEEIDITDKVINLLDSRYKKEEVKERKKKP